MPSIRQLQQQAQEDRQRRDEYWQTYIPHVLASRLIIRADNTSYFDQVGIYSSTLKRRGSVGVEEDTLLSDYPGLREEDLKVSMEFEMLRALRLL